MGIFLCTNVPTCGQKMCCKICIKMYQVKYIRTVALQECREMKLANNCASVYKQASAFLVPWSPNGWGEVKGFETHLKDFFKKINHKCY